MKFILTIDTEGDNQWDHGRKLTVENIKFIPRLQDLCNKYSIKPTYLVTSEVCDDPFAKEIFNDYLVSDKAEIGAHLHSWTTPPFLDKNGYRFNDDIHAFASELPIELVSQKIKNLTNQIQSSFGIRPLSFRSGRYGFNDDIARILKENSYLVDSSVTSFTNWSVHKGIPGGKGGPDFSDCLPQPYFYETTNGHLLEIPVTILPTKFPFNKSHSLTKYYLRNVNNSLFLRGLRKGFFNKQPLWLRPYSWMNIDLFNDLITEAENLKLPFIVMIFHSSELMPGCSIYRKDKESIEKLYDLLERLFILLDQKNISSYSLTEAAQNYKV